MERRAARYAITSTRTAARAGSHAPLRPDAAACELFRSFPRLRRFPVLRRFTELVLAIGRRLTFFAAVRAGAVPFVGFIFQATHGDGSSRGGDGVQDQRLRIERSPPG